MLSHLIGNEHVKLTLQRLITSGRVPHSLLLAGDEGVGKRQFALELAKSILCSGTEDGEACDVCAACRRADVFALPKGDDKEGHERVILSEHPDLGVVIPYNRNILVKAIRDLEKEANFLPYEAAGRVFIIDDAEKMNDAASNALLKTLEEPPATSHIFLVTSRPASLLPTIRSRCQTLRFAPVETHEIERFLIEYRAFSHDEARLASRLSRGSIGRAVSLNIPTLKANRDRMFGVLATAIGSGEMAPLLRASEEMNDAKNKENFEESLDLLESLIHDVWTLTSGGDEPRLTNSDLAEELSGLAPRAESSTLLIWTEQIEMMRSNLIVNINKRVAADGLFVSMAA